MTDKTANTVNFKKIQKSLFKENPYDIEVVFESLSIASDNNLELIFMDKLLNSLRNSNENVDLTTLSFDILRELHTI